ncbi:MAG: hypothetical protein OJF52_001662 [Nitrospira sp.]|nr:MAG: hypothetical protein OJF52_001662 [Nitrospira sp.]
MAGYRTGRRGSFGINVLCRPVRLVSTILSAQLTMIGGLDSAVTLN